MDLMVTDVAKLLKVPEDTVNAWVKEGQIPSYHINNEVRFDPSEIEAWVLKEKTGSAPGAYPFAAPSATEESNDTAEAGTARFGLYRALHHGFVFTDVPGTTKEEVIRETVQQLATRIDADADVLTELLLDRERMMPTALNNGVAVPHTRDFLLDRHYDMVTLVFPKEPIEYGALDGQPVHSMFFLFACEDKRHLNLLAKLAHFTSQEECMAFLKSHPEKQSLLDFIKVWESKL